MAIIEQMLDENLILRYSDSGFMIRQIETGDMYAEAVDLVTSTIHYEETDIPIEQEEEQEETPEEDPIEKEYAEAGKILLGENNE